MTKVGVWLAAWVMASGAWAAAPQTAAHQRPVPGSAARRDPVQPKLNDAQLEAAIRARFAKSKINEDRFTVRVQGGVATIDGKTGVLQHKGVATRLSKTAGAVAVNNRVQVSDAAKKKAAGNLEQGRRRAQIKRGEERSDRK